MLVFSLYSLWSVTSLRGYAATGDGLTVCHLDNRPVSLGGQNLAGTAVREREKGRAGTRGRNVQLLGRGVTWLPIVLLVTCTVTASDNVTGGWKLGKNIKVS